MSRYYQHEIDDHSNGRRPPEEALSFLGRVPDAEITDRERCAILATLLENVLDRLKDLEAKAAEG